MSRYICVVSVLVFSVLFLFRRNRRDNLYSSRAIRTVSKNNSHQKKKRKKAPSPSHVLEKSFLFFIFNNNLNNITRTIPSRGDLLRFRIRQFVLLRFTIFISRDRTMQYYLYLTVYFCYE